MLMIETKKLNINEELKKKVDMMCKFAYAKPTYKMVILEILKELISISYLRNEQKMYHFTKYML